MIRACMIVVCALVAVSATAQVDMKLNIDSLTRIGRIKPDSVPWKWYTKWGLGFSTTQLTNWTQGGQDAFGLNLSCLASYDYADSIYSWDNDLQLGYGLVRQGQQDVQKSDDRIILSSRASRVTSTWYRYTGFVDFRTQFVDGFNYSSYDSAAASYQRISSFFAPAYLTTAIGADVSVTPELRFLIAPLSSRSTFVLDNRLVETGRLSGAGVFGLPPGVRSHTNIGSVVNIKIDWDVFQNVSLRTRFNGFMPFESTDLWVLTLENSLVMKVNSWLNVSWLADVFYDDRIPITRTDGTVGPATQYRNQINININYSLGS